MRKLSLRAIRDHPGRFAATVLAIFVSTAFLAFALVLQASLGDALRASVEGPLSGVDAVVTPIDATAGGRRGPGAPDEGSTRLPASLLASVQATPGVDQAAGIVSGPTSVFPASGDGTASKATGQDWVESPTLSGFTLVEGRGPTAAGEITLDSRTASQKGYGLGDTVRLGTAVGEQHATLVGTTSYGNQSSAGIDGDVLVDPEDAADWLAGSGQSGWDEVRTTASAGVSQDELEANLSAAVAGPTVAVQTGSAYLTQQGDDAVGIADAIGTGLTAFAYVALVVGAFIIYNTFTTTVKQRQREFALLRAVGANGAQVRRMVRWEAILLGLGASALGVLGGMLGVYVLARTSVLTDLAGGADVGLTVTVGSVVQVILSGLIITVLSALVPAWRASRVKPVEAMRAAADDRSGTNKVRAVLGLGVLGLGTLLLVVDGLKANLFLLLFGVIFLILGILVAGPVLATLFGRLVGWPLLKFGRAPTRLAVDNAVRNPTRTATTANALVVGVFLVVFVTSAGGTLRDYAVVQVEKLSGADLVVMADPGTTFAPSVVDAITSAPDIEAHLAAINRAGRVGDERPVSAADPATAGDVLGLKVLQGSLEGLRDDQIAVIDRAGARGNGKPATLGEPVAVTFPNGTTRTFSVGAVMQVSLDLPGDLITPAAARSADPSLEVNEYALRTRSGTANEVEQQIKDVSDSYANLTVVPGNFIAQLIRVVFDALISAVNYLLAAAIIIAVFGIVNTLFLAITERTQEIGLLRSVGMSRRQLRSSVRTESIIVALLGTTMGMVFGLFVGWTVTRPLASQGGSFTWPFESLGVILALGLIIGVGASLLPAWRASRLNIIESMRVE